MQIQRVTRMGGVRESVCVGWERPTAPQLSRRLRRTGRPHPTHTQYPAVDRIRYQTRTSTVPSRVQCQYLVQPEPVPAQDLRRYLIQTKASLSTGRNCARKETPMSKFKVEHGASKVNLVLLKINIEDTISQDIDMMSTWSNNDRKYIVNELLRFALTQEEDFQKYKVSATANASRPAISARLSPAKSEPSLTSTTTHS
jgi:hypothetical protein